jgi:hypothetical protein
MSALSDLNQGEQRLITSMAGPLLAGLSDERILQIMVSIRDELVEMCEEFHADESGSDRPGDLAIDQAGAK